MKVLIGAIALVILMIGAPAMAKKHHLPQCDGSFQDCINNNGDFCKAGGTEDKCECSDDMSDCPNHPNVLAYQSGYKHGAHDANCTDESICHDYIGTPGQGFSHHTHEFINGYIRGYCSVALLRASDSGVTGKDVNFSCSKGLGFSDIA